MTFRDKFFTVLSGVLIILGVISWVAMRLTYVSDSLIQIATNHTTYFVLPWVAIIMGCVSYGIATKKWF